MKIKKISEWNKWKGTRSKIDYGSRTFASLPTINIGMPLTSGKNTSSADLNLTLQGYEFDHGSIQKLVKLLHSHQSSPEGLPLPSRNGGTNFDTFEFLKPLEHPRHSGALNPGMTWPRCLNSALLSPIPFFLCQISRSFAILFTFTEKRSRSYKLLNFLNTRY